MLQRGTDAIQIGLDPADGIILTSVLEGTDQLLGMLDGTHQLSKIRNAASDLGIAGSYLTWMLQVLDSARLLHHIKRSIEHADAIPYGNAAPAERQASVGYGSDVGDGSFVDPACGRRHAERIQNGRVRVVGSGRLAHAVGASLLVAGIGRLYLADAAGSDNMAGAVTLASQLEPKASTTLIRPVSHWSKPEHPPPDLTVIALDAAEPPRRISDDYARSDQRHLFVRPMPDAAIVGPLVDPGSSPCICCLDHIRRDADPGWPYLLKQLGGYNLAIPTFAAHWAGITATTQILSVLAQQRASVVGATIEISPGDFSTQVRKWPMHPDCGCAWRD